MEALTKQLIKAGIGVELLVPTEGDNLPSVGIRLRPFGKSLNQDVMLLGIGMTFAEALQDAVDKSKEGRWEPLDWAARPWVTFASRRGKDAAAFGLV